MPTGIFFQSKIYEFARAIELQPKPVKVSSDDPYRTRIRVLADWDHRARIVSKLIIFAAFENNFYMVSVIGKITVFQTAKIIETAQRTLNYHSPENRSEMFRLYAVEITPMRGDFLLN